jgi:hypothetical protein
MASGFITSNGTDLDSIFAPRYSGWPQAAATEFVTGGSDLNTRYAPLSSGSASSLTAFRLASGADLNTVFAAYGTTGVRVGTQPSAVSGSQAAGHPSGTVTSNATTCAGAGGSGSYTYTWICSGCTANSPHSQTTTFSATVNAASTVNATAYCQISDGVTSTNTGTIPVTLQNTSAASWNFTITAGTWTNIVGYQPTEGAGSITGGTDGPLTIFAIWDVVNLGNSFIEISGFTSDPGKTSLTSVVANGVTKLGSSAIYSYNSSSGVATWEWQGPGNVFGFVNGSVYPVVVTASFTG